MTTEVTRGTGVRDEPAAVHALQEAGMAPSAWGNDPGATYGRHRHDYHKVLYCVAGSITFHTADGDLPLSAGDRLDLAAGVEHAATVGGDGVRCVEGARPAGS